MLCPISRVIVGGSPLGPVAYLATGSGSHLMKQVFSPFRKWLFVFSMIVSVTEVK